MTDNSELEQVEKDLTALREMLERGIDVSAQIVELEQKRTDITIHGNINGPAVIGDGTMQTDNIAGRDIIDLRNAHATLNFFERTDRVIWLKKYLLNLITERGRLPQEIFDNPDDESRLRLWRVYTAPDVSEHGRRPALSALNTSPRLVLLGGPGTGKTTFANFVTLCMAGEMLRREHDPGLDDLRRRLPEKQDDEDSIPELVHDDSLWRHKALLPISVRLREFAASDHFPNCKADAKADCLLRFVRDGARPELALEPPFYECLVEYLTGKEGDGVLLVLDGLDEVPYAEEKRGSLRRVIEMFAETYERCRILVTSRPYAYVQEQWRIDGFVRAELAPFEPPQVRLFTWQWYNTVEATDRRLAEARAQTLSNAVLGDPRLRTLSRVPLLLTMMALVHRRDKGQLPRGRAMLYERVTDLLLLRWNRLENDDDLEHTLGLPLADIRAVLERLAYEVHSAQKAGEELAALLLKGRLLEALDEERVKQNTRGVPIGDIAEYLSLRAGILLPEGNNAFRFPHRSFQEFLAACYFTDQTRASYTLPPVVIQEPTRWREVALLAAARVSGNPDSFEVLMSALCKDNPPAERNDPRWWGALLAGLALNETGESLAFEAADEVRRWLVALLEAGALPPVDRAEAGRVLSVLGDTRYGVGVNTNGIPEMDWVEIPAGEFLMGSTKEESVRIKKETNMDLPSDELQQHLVNLPAYHIARYPVTWVQYTVFMDDAGYSNSDYWTETGWEWREAEKHDQPVYWDKPEEYIANHPANGICWYEAMAFCEWLSGKLGYKVRLPTEAEWEKTARGTDGRRYPWGEEFDAGKCNVDQTGIGRTSAVGMFPDGASPYGVLDLSGNVYEWCQSKKMDYLYNPDDGREDTTGYDPRVLRGGSFIDHRRDTRAAYRFVFRPSYINSYYGFRVVAPILL